MSEQQYGPRGEHLYEPETIEGLMGEWQAEELTHMGSNEPYKVADGDGSREERDRVRDAFLAGEIDEPVVTYPRLDMEALQAGHRRLSAIYHRSRSLPDSIDKDLMRELMRRKIYEIHRHLDVARAWATDDPNMRQAYLARAAETQMMVFGRPDQHHFDAMVHTLRDQATTVAERHEGGQLGTIAQELLAMTGDRPAPEGLPPVGLTDHALEVLKPDIDSIYSVDDQILPPSSERPMSHDLARIWLRLIQEANGMQQAGWDTRFTDGTAVETTRHRRSVDIGRSRTLFTDTDLRSRSKHETRGHGQRGFNGDKLAANGKPMAAFALPGSLDFEEGLMVSIEQISSGERKIPGRQYYTAIGLMLGMDRPDGQPRTFRETFEVMWRRSAIEAAQAGKQPNLDAIKNTAYQTMMRIYRGGALDTRDLAYYDGYVKASNWLNSIAELPHHERRAKWSYAMSAQFDPTNPLHAAYITR